MSCLSRLDDLQRAMIQQGFFPDKKYSQNFLIDDRVIQKLVGAAEVKPGETVLEIGPGTGFVTEELVKTRAKVRAIEFRPELCAYLRSRFDSFSNVEIIEKDILQATKKELVFDKVVASPPYAISDDIMYLVLNAGFTRASMLWQLEFVEKILAPPGSSEYHPLSIVTQYLYDGELVARVSPKSFYPIPNHFSAILLLKQRKKRVPISDLVTFEKWLKTLFRFKNKTLQNVGKQLHNHPILNVSPASFEKALHSLDLHEEKVFLLEPEDFVELFEVMQKNK